MFDSNYMTSDELKATAKLLDILDAFTGLEISVGTIPVLDVDGEVLGYIRGTDGTYGLYKTAEDE